MALWESIKSLARGNFSDAAAYLWVDQETVDSGRAADSQLEALAKRDLDRGIYSPEQYQVTMDRLAANKFEPGGIFDQEGTDVVGGFMDGAKEGLNNIQTSVKESVRGTINFSLGFIPWQAWILIALYLAWRFGWLKKLVSK